ncbi:MAG: peptide chain release factor 2, partial [Rubricoccaceae bacterium]|nr:peptide chain release factor 2 [Rubricoccaceae bacterium]
MEELLQRVEALGTYLDIDGRKERLAELQQQRLDPSFWDDPASAQKTEKEVSLLKSWIDAFESLVRRRDDILTLQELQDEEEDADLAGEIEKEMRLLEREVEALELRGMLSGEDDHRDAILNINPGAGGTEAQDWAEMLLRMYTRYGEQQGWTVSLLERQDGEGAGIKSATLRIEGDMAYGYLKAESGVHRLVRISPFDSSGRRHTSVASVFVYPEIDDDIEVDLSSGELELQRFHSGGKGGQNVNKVETGVRYVWEGVLSNGEKVKVAAESTEERSQLQNRERAMAMLKSRIYGMEQQIREAAKDELEGSKKKIEWGS